MLALRLHMEFSPERQTEATAVLRSLVETLGRQPGDDTPKRIALERRENNSDLKKKTPGGVR